MSWAAAISAMLDPDLPRAISTPPRPGRGPAGSSTCGTHHAPAGRPRTCGTGEHHSGDGARADFFLTVRFVRSGPRPWSAPPGAPRAPGRRSSVGHARAEVPGNASGVDQTLVEHGRAILRSA